MKIQPINFNLDAEPPPMAKQVNKSRLKRIFERQFSSVLRISPPQATEAASDSPYRLDEFEPSSVCLAKMVQNFIEENNERCERKRCNCFGGNCTGISDDESDGSSSPSTDDYDVLKSLVPCLYLSERNLLADTSKIIEKNKMSKRKDKFCRKIVADGLTALGYTASICQSKWERSPSFPAGEYEYVEVIIEEERYIIDIEFRSEFEVARSTKAYKTLLQSLPTVFVGQVDRLEKIITIVSKAARQSLNKKGMPCPPWRKAEYMKAKWLSPFTRINSIPVKEDELIIGWNLKPLEIKPCLRRRAKIVTGLANVFEN